MWQFSKILHETRHKLKLEISHAVVEKGLILAHYKALFHTNVPLKLCRTMLYVSFFCPICRRQNVPSTFCNSFWWWCVFVQARLDIIHSVQFCVYPKAISREYHHQEEETSGRHPHQILKSPKLLPQEQKFSCELLPDIKLLISVICDLDLSCFCLYECEKSLD